MFNAMKSKGLALFALVLASLVASPAFAQVDVSAVTDAISATLIPIAAIGGGVLLVYVAIKTYKWVRRAM